MELQDYKGNIFDIKNASWQHLSNIVWINNIVNYSKKEKGDKLKDREMGALLEAKRLIDLKHGGKVLMYQPMYDFKDEINFLYREGLLQKKDGYFTGIIEMKGKIIGAVNTIKQFKEYKINNKYKFFDRETKTPY